jgi:hypothetical protein
MLPVALRTHCENEVGLTPLASVKALVGAVLKGLTSTVMARAIRAEYVMSLNIVEVA